MAKSILNGEPDPDEHYENDEEPWQLLAAAASLKHDPPCSVLPASYAHTANFEVWPFVEIDGWMDR